MNPLNADKPMATGKPKMKYADLEQRVRAYAESPAAENPQRDVDEYFGSFPPRGKDTKTRDARRLLDITYSKLNSRPRTGIGMPIPRYYQLHLALLDYTGYAMISEARDKTSKQKLLLCKEIRRLVEHYDIYRQNMPKWNSLLEQIESAEAGEYADLRKQAEAAAFYAKPRQPLKAA